MKATTQVGVGTTEIHDAALNDALNMSPAGQLKQRVGITLACENLPNLDRSSKTDAMCVLFDVSGRHQKRIGETEIIADSLNPEFVKEFNVDYYFEQQQKFRIEVYDIDDANNLTNLKA